MANTTNAPTLGNGKICYIEIPATDSEESAEFYEKIFGWTVRKRANGQLENTSRVRVVRREIARIQTVQGERRRKTQQ